MTTLLSIFEEQKALEEKLRELNEKASNQKAIAVEEIKTIIANNCLNYSDLNLVFLELRAISGEARPYEKNNGEIKNTWRYYNPETKQGWIGSGTPPKWFMREIDNKEKIDAFLLPHKRARGHSPIVLEMIGACPPEQTIVERVVDKQWITEKSEQMNRLYKNNIFTGVKSIYGKMTEAEQEAVFDNVEPEVQEYITSQNF